MSELDSNVTITVKDVGIPEVTARMNALSATITKLTVNANGTVTASGKLTSTLDAQSKSTDAVTSATGRASKAQESYFLHIAKTTVQSALVNKAFLLMVDSMGKAVQQADLIANFPASMGALGLSVKDASDSFAKLKQYIQSVGGDLTKAAMSVARFAGVNKNIKASVAEFAGLNNALIAGGASTEVQASALEQMTQAYSRGRPQLIEWKSALVAMAPQLDQVAKKMGFINAGALGEALTQGEASMQNFMTTLAQMGTGTGPIAQQAIARMQGIQFASNVLKNTLTNGLTAIYQAVGRQNIVAFFTYLTQVISVLASWVATLISIFVSLFNTIGKLFGGTPIALKDDTAGVVENLETGVGAVGDLGDGLDDAGKSAQKLNKSLASFDKMNVLADKTSADSGKKSSGSGGAAGGGLDAANASILGEIFDNLGGKIQEASIWAKIFAGILVGIIALKFAASIVNGIALIKTSFETLGSSSFIGMLTNPYVLLVVAILAVIAAVVYLYNTNEDFKKGWDSVWGPIIDTIKKVATAIKVTLVGAFEWLSKKFAEWTAPFKPVFDWIGKQFNKFSEWITKVAKDLGLLNSPMETLGKVLAVLAAAIAFSLLLPIFLFVTVISVAVAVVVAIITGILALINLIWTGLQAAWNWITTAFQTAWNFVVGVWNSITEFFTNLWDGIIAIFVGVWNWLKEWGLTVLAVLMWPFTLMLAVVMTVVDAVVKLFTWLWDQIVAIWTPISAWFSKIFSDAWNGIVSVWNTVASWFNTNVIQPIVVFFSPIIAWFGKVFSNAWEGIKKVWSAVAGWFGGVWNGIVSIFSGVGQWFGNVFQSAWDKVTSIFSGLWNWFKTNVWDKIVSVFSSIGTVIGNAVSGAFKAIVNTVLSVVVGIINGFLNAINWAIDVINKIPGVNIKKVPTMPVPQLARGGVVSQSTLAILGDNGEEAVVPLENNLEWIDKLASKINSAGGSGQPIQLTVQIGEERIITKIIDLINEKTQMSGRNAILV